MEVDRRELDIKKFDEEIVRAHRRPQSGRARTRSTVRSVTRWSVRRRSAARPKKHVLEILMELDRIQEQKVEEEKHLEDTKVAFERKEAQDERAALRTRRSAAGTAGAPRGLDGRRRLQSIWISTSESSRGVETFAIARVDGQRLPRLSRFA